MHPFSYPAGEYFTNIAAFAKYYTGNFTALASVLDAAGLGATLTSSKWEGTLFAPLDASWGGAAKALPELAALAGSVKLTAAQKARVAGVLNYHQVGHARAHMHACQLAPAGKPVPAPHCRGAAKLAPRAHKPPPLCAVRVAQKRSCRRCARTLWTLSAARASRRATPGTT